VIYYGDEYGMPGANDPDNRRMMHFTGLNNREEDVKSTVQQLTYLRNSNMALLFGDVRLITYNESVFAYVRYYFNESALIVFNKSREPKSIAISKDILQMENYVSHFGSTVEHQSDQVIIELEPLSFDIITNEN
jgi:glycosidase